jgi:hypothetical protein
MDIEALAPYLLLAASFAAALGGLLIHAQTPRDVAQRAPISDKTRIRPGQIANALFALSLTMLGWAAIWFIGQRATGFVDEAGTIMHKLFVAAIALVTGLAGYWQRRSKAQKRDGGR